LQRQVGLFAIPLSSRQHGNRTCKNQTGSRNAPDSGCVISVDPGLSPAPSTVRGQGTPPSGPLPWRGSATYSSKCECLQMRTMRESETFLIVIDEDRKQFAVEGPLTDVQLWNRAVAAAQEGGRDVRSLTFQRRHALPRSQSGSGTMAICTVWLNREELSIPRRSRICAHT